MKTNLSRLRRWLKALPLPLIVKMVLFLMEVSSRHDWS